MNEKKKKQVVVMVFAAAMAWVEAATVVYLRILTGRLQPYPPRSLSGTLGTGLSGIEAIREVATLIMLLAVGWLAGWKELAKPPGIHLDRLRNMGYSILRFPGIDRSVASLDFRLGRTVSHSTAMVGAGDCTRIHFGIINPERNPNQPV